MSVKWSTEELHKTKNLTAIHSGCCQFLVELALLFGMFFVVCHWHFLSHVCGFVHFRVRPLSYWWKPDSCNASYCAKGITTKFLWGRGVWCPFTSEQQIAFVKTVINWEGRFAAREASEIFTVLVCHQSVTCHTNMFDFTAGAITCSEGMYYEGTGFFKAEVPGWFCAMTSRHGCT